MNFDTVIIGGGLSGLVCGLKLVKSGKKCAIVSTGQSALHFSSGSFGLFGNLNGSDVENPLEAIKQVVQENKNHPYAKIGADNIEALADECVKLISCVQKFEGSAAKNHYRITPLGDFRPAWLTFDGFLTTANKNEVAYKNALVISIKGFLDAYPEMVAENLQACGCNANIAEIDLEKILNVKRNPSEMRSIFIAKILDNAENLKSVADTIKQIKGSADVVIVPDCIGLKNIDARQQLEEQIGVAVKLVATFPPLASGVRMQLNLRAEFVRNSGTFFAGDEVVSVEKTQEGFVIATSNLDITKLYAKNVVLATGSFFSKGVVSSPEKVFEPLFSCDVFADHDRENWTDLNPNAEQKFHSYGVQTNSNFNILKDGNPIQNAYAIGALLGGYNPLQENSGAGVAILSATQVAKNIIG